MSRAGLMAYLAALGITTTTVDHPPVFTVAESETVDLKIAGGHTKNLFLKDAKGALFLVTAHASTAVDLKGLPKVIGSARLSFGRPELLFEVLGVTPGSVTAFALVNDQTGKVAFVLDKALMDFDIINGHPLENSATTSIARDDLLRFSRATGHEPQVVQLDGSAPKDRT